jgi:phospholipid transport system substrate-binding protein
MSVLSRRGLFGAAAVGVLGRATRAMADDNAAILAPIAALDAALLAVMKAGTATMFTQRFQMLAPAIDSALDLQEILERSVGPSWSSFPPDQQTALQTVFRTFTIASYVANFATFDGETLEVLPELRVLGDDRIVQSRLVPRVGTATAIDYVMHGSGSGWKVVDVLLNGSISRVAVQRSDFRSLIRTGDASSLIRSLQRKISDLSGGTMA